MWESRVLSEIAKLLWKSFCDFRRSVISTAARLSSWSPPLPSIPGIADSGRRLDRRSWGILRGRVSGGSASRAPTAPFPHTIALALRGDHRRVMGQPIEQGGRELLVAGKHGTHSANVRFVVTTVARRSYRSVIRLKSNSPPTRSKGTKPSSSMSRTSTRRSR